MSGDREAMMKVLEASARLAGGEMLEAITAVVMQSVLLAEGILKCEDESGKADVTDLLRAVVRLKQIAREQAPKSADIERFKILVREANERA